MKRQSIIRKSYAGLLLLVFLAAITPRPVLHDIFTSHSHTYAKMDGAKEASINKVGFSCDCNKLNALSPFVAEPEPLVADVATYPVPQHAAHTETNHSACFLSISSRGPPAVA